MVVIKSTVSPNLLVLYKMTQYLKESYDPNLIPLQEIWTQEHRRKPCEDRKGNYSQAKWRSLRRSQPYQQLDLGLLSIKTGKKKICCLNHSVCDSFVLKIYFTFIYFVYKCFVCMSICAPHGCLVPLDALGQELQMTVSARNQIHWVFWKSS